MVRVESHVELQISPVNEIDDILLLYNYAEML